MEDIQELSRKLDTDGTSDTWGIGRTLLTLAYIDCLLNKVLPNGRTREHRTLIDKAIKKLDECQKQQDKTEDQEDSITGFKYYFQIHKQQFSTSSKNNDRLGSGGARSPAKTFNHSSTPATTRCL